MCRMPWVLALLALHAGLAHSWDIAVSHGYRLEFYTDGTVTNTVNLISHNLTALAYDEVHNMMLYVDKQRDNDALCGYNLFSMENKCLIKRTGSNIESIVYDPPTETLFFTDMNERSINWISLKPGSINNVYGNLLIKMDDRTPSNIAVDSCRGYIYWTNRISGKEEYMERARFDGSEREILSNWLPYFDLAMDQQTQKLYYFDGCESCSYEFLREADLNGKYSEIYLLHSHYSTPQALTVTKDYLYWMNGSSSRTIWHLPKNAIKGVEPNEIAKFYSTIPLAITANYKIKDQIQGLQDCEPLSSLISSITVTNDSLNIQQTTQKQQITETENTRVVEPFCVHGIKVNETSGCNCAPGYIGERCDVSVCVNYCLQGDCSFNDEGLPKCRCNGGYSGERCEVYACHGYCLNSGVCSLNEEEEPVCQCVGNHEGTRCETVKDGSFTVTNTPTNYSAKRNLSLADFLSNWRKPTAKISIVVEV